MNTARDRAMPRRALLLGALQVAPRPAPRKVRIGVVGGRFGLQFQWHLHPDSEVTAVCDIRPDRLDAMASTYRTGNTYRDYEQMLRQAQLDAVAVFTPAPLHAAMSISAMEAGKHVVAAVPAGLSIDELDRLVDCVRRTGMKYAMAETTYYRPQIIACRRWATEGQFGEVFYSESEYHHNITGLMFDENNQPTWRHGLPPMFYITHQTGAIIPVTGERLTEVSAIGWGDGHAILQRNEWRNPFWNTNGFFKTTRGHACRISVYWRAPLGHAQRTEFHGSKRSYVMGRLQEAHADTTFRFDKGDKTVAEPPRDTQEKYWHLLPKQLHVKTGHEGSHTHITHDFIRAITEDRLPEVNVWEAAAYTAPGLVAHLSALDGGTYKKIPDFGKAPV